MIVIKKEVLTTVLVISSGPYQSIISGNDTVVVIKKEVLTTGLVMSLTIISPPSVVMTQW